MNVSIRELKSHLSELLDRVADGEELTVTKRGTPIARVSAISANDVTDPLARIASADWITPPSKSKPMLGATHPIVFDSAEPTLSDMVREDRQ